MTFNLEIRDESLLECKHFRGKPFCWSILFCWTCWTETRQATNNSTVQLKLEKFTGRKNHQLTGKYLETLCDQRTFWYFYSGHKVHPSTSFADNKLFFQLQPVVVCAVLSGKSFVPVNCPESSSQICRSWFLTKQLKMAAISFVRGGEGEGLQYGTRY